MTAPAMMNIQWEDVTCHICNSGKSPEIIMLHGKPLVDGQFGYAVHPVICECGLVFLNPRWSKDAYNVFYENYYDDLYRLEIKPEYGIKGVIDNMAVIWNRIRDKTKTSIKHVLDIGCGTGYGLKYLKEQLPGSRIYGIESSPECARSLQGGEIGATLVTTDFDADWTTDYQGKFDLIILRHVVEHMLDPVENLKKVRTVLAEDGTVYISTPDMMHPRITLRDYNKWWEYWFRAVHPYYYSKETLIRTMELAGLYPNIYGEENEEFWCLGTIHKSPTFESNGVYRKQKEILDLYLK